MLARGAGRAARRPGGRTHHAGSERPRGSGGPCWVASIRRWRARRLARRGRRRLSRRADRLRTRRRRRRSRRPTGRPRSRGPRGRPGRRRAAPRGGSRAGAAGAGRDPPPGSASVARRGPSGAGRRQMGGLFPGRGSYKHPCSTWVDAIGEVFLASTGRCHGFRRMGEFPRFLREICEAKHKLFKFRLVSFEDESSACRWLIPVLKALKGVVSNRPMQGERCS